MEALRAVLAQFGVEVDTSKLDKADDQIESFMGQIRKLGGILAGGALVNAVRTFVDTTTNAFDEVADSAARLQVSTDALQEWRYAAKLSGIEAGQLEAAVSTFQRALQGVAEGSDKPTAALRKLGVEAKDAQGKMRPFEAMLPEIADGIAKLPNDTERAGAAMRLFGRGGLTMLPLLQQGAEGIQALKDEFHELGGGASQEAIRSMAAYRDEVDRADMAMEGMKAEMVLSLLPAFTWLSNAARDVSKVFTDLARNTHLVDVALGVLTVAVAAMAIKMGIAFAPVLGPILAIGAGILVLVAAVDDLWTTFEGGESVIQGVVDEMWGVGATADVVEGLIDLWDDLVTNILEAGQAVKEYLGMGKAEKVEDRGDKRTRERQERQNEAVAGGSLEDFARARQRAGRTNQESIKAEFLERRRKMIEGGQVEATEDDVASGLADSVGGKALPGKAKPKPAGPTKDDAARALNASNAPLPVVTAGQVAPGWAAGGGTATAPQIGGGPVVQSNMKIDIMLPPGADKNLQEEMRKAAATVFDERLRGARAALVGTGG